MSKVSIIFLVLSIVLLVLGFYGGSVQVPETAEAAQPSALAMHFNQYANFYLILGGLILFIVLPAFS